MYTYKTHMTCSSQINIQSDDNPNVDERVIQDVQFIGGCSGNLQGVVSLVRGMKVNDAIERLKGIQCRGGTSCPDQLSCALELMQAEAKGI